MTEETPLTQVLNIGAWMVGSMTAITDWENESDDMREMLHSLVDYYLDEGGDLSNLITDKSLPQVMDQIRHEAAQDPETYPYALKEW